MDTIKLNHGTRYGRNCVLGSKQYQDKQIGFECMFPLFSSSKPHRLINEITQIVLAGLLLQLLSFLLFTLIYLRFIYRVKTLRPEVWRRDAVSNALWYRDWRALAFALFVSCVGNLVSLVDVIIRVSWLILIPSFKVRSLFRVIELSQGFKGPLATTRNKSIFYGLDTLPLFIAVSAFFPFWPERFIPHSNTIRKTNTPRDNESDIQGTERSSSLAT